MCATQMGTELQLKKKTLFKCFPRTPPKPRFGGCGAEGSTQHELRVWVLGCRVEEVPFHITSDGEAVAVALSVQRAGTNLHRCGARSLSACPCRQFSVRSLFSVVGLVVQPCTLFRRQ